MPSGPTPRRAVFFGVIAIVLSLTPTALSGDLDRVSDAARRGSPAPRPPGGQGASYDGTTRPGPIAVLAGKVFFYVAISPWLVPHHVLEDRRMPNAALRARFADYPYANGADGFLFDPPADPLFELGTVDGGLARQATSPPPTQPLAAQLATEAGFDAGMIRTGFRGRLQMPLRLEIDADWSLYREIERLRVDSAWLGREHLSIRFAESSAVQFRSGIGPQHLLDSSGWVHGIDLTWGFDAFPTRPLTLGFEASVGTLGNAFAGGVHTYIGILQGPVEVSAGWRHRWIGDVDLGGPFASIRFWL